MIKIKEAIVVEGRYDKNTLSQIVDAPIFVTNGFGIFKDKAQMALLRQGCPDRWHIRWQHRLPWGQQSLWRIPKSTRGY